MALPFLHKFLTSFGRGKATTQLMRESTHQWALSLLGADGPQLLQFEVMGLGESAPRKAGVFIYACRRAGEWRALYIGESADLSARLAFNEIAADALLSGATDIHIAKTNLDAKDRRDIADRLCDGGAKVEIGRRDHACSSYLYTPLRKRSFSSSLSM